MNNLAVESLNPFRDAPVAAAPAEAMVAISSSREVAEVQTAMLMARRFPRNEVDAMDHILQACTRPSLAQGALYEYARGGTDIRGPSVRLAECIAQYWGHLDFGWRVLEERPGVTKVQTFAWDLQTGVRSQVVFDVTHERVAGGNKKQLHDPRDIYEHIANAASRRLRSCILRTIPGDVVEAAVQQCEVTMKTKAEVTPERLANLVTQFAEFGVTKANIEKRIQRRIESMTPGMMMQLGKVFTSLRDGMSEPGDWFSAGDAPQAVEESAGAPAAPTGTVNPRQAVRDRLQKRKTEAHTPQPHPTPPPPPPPQQPGVPMPSLAIQDIMRFSRAAQTSEDLERVRGIAQQLTDEAEVLLAQDHIDAAAKRIEG